MIALVFFFELCDSRKGESGKRLKKSFPKQVAVWGWVVVFLAGMPPPNPRTSTKKQKEPYLK